MRLVFAQHGSRIYAEVQWMSAHGLLTRVPSASGELAPETSALLRNFIVAKPEMTRWQIERHGGKAAVGPMRDESKGPEWSIKLPQSLEADAEALLVWADDYIAEWNELHDAYVLERHADRLRGQAERLRADQAEKMRANSGG